MNYSNTNDEFLNTKGRELRNKQKKLDKIVSTEKQAKKGEIQLSDLQKEMITKKGELQSQCKEL